MIAALNTNSFYYQQKLRSEFGIPNYILNSLDERSLLEIIEKAPINPWSLYSKENNFSIKLCDSLAERFKVNNDLEKCKGYLQYALDVIAEQGHCYATQEQIKYILKNQNFSDYIFQEATNRLQKQNIIFVNGKNDYILLNYFMAEKSFADLLDKHNIKKRQNFRKRKSLSYERLNEIQKEAVNAIENNSLIILTGSAGTGKTTVIKSICDCYGEDAVLLFAPTGKAASRLTEVCSVQARTLHSYFLNPNAEIINDRIIVIDEISMMDIEIAGRLSDLIGDNCVLFLVGDYAQLPSVGPGEILKDILDSKIGTCYNLINVLRQNPGSLLESASNIRDGKFLVSNKDNEVITFYPSVWDLERLTTKLLTHSEWKDAQILCTLKKNGSDIINKIAQNILSKKINNSDIFNIGDKVIHTKNNKDLDVYNGDTGIILRNTDKFTYVEFRDKIVEYPKSLLWQLDLAYAITIHKSQGSEFDKTILIIQPSRITSKNLIYTGLTRARKRTLIISPSQQIILNGIERKQEARQTSLKWLLEQVTYE